VGDYKVTYYLMGIFPQIFSVLHVGPGVPFRKEEKGCLSIKTMTAKGSKS
jgi:hypothetical protein